MNVGQHYNLSVKDRILTFEKMSDKSPPVSVNKSHTLQHNYENLTSVQNEQKLSELTKSIIVESNHVTQTSSLEEHTLVDENHLNDSLVKLSDKTDKIEQEVLPSTVSSDSSVTKPEEQLSIKSSKTPIQEKITSSVSDETRQKMATQLNSFGTLVQNITDNKGKKLALVTDSQGKKHLGVANRGLLEFKAGSSEKTNALMTKMLPKMMEDVLRTGDAKLMYQYKNQLIQLKNSPWGSTICNNNPTIMQSLNAMIKTLEASIKNEFKVSTMLMGLNPDKELTKSFFAMAGWGVVSNLEIEKSFLSAIQTLKEMKEAGKSVDNELENLISSALQLFEKRPPIKNLRNQDGEMDFLNHVLNPLADLASGTEFDGIGDKFKSLYGTPPSVELNVIKQENKQDGVTFKAKMKAIAQGQLSDSEKKTLLEGMTQDFRSHWSTILTHIDEGEFDNQGWSKNESIKTSPNIVLATNEMNQQNRGIMDIVLSNCENPFNPTEVKLQCEFLCDLLEQAMKDHNYSVVYLIHASLNSIPLHRLFTDPRVDISEKHKEIFNQARHITSQNKSSGEYRKNLTEAQEKFRKGELKNAPIPFLGLFQTDLTFISDTNENQLDGKPNVFKINLLQKNIGFFQSLKKDLKKDADNPIRLTGFIDASSQFAKDNASKGVSDYEEFEALKKKSYSLSPNKTF
jgi:hypothetical protein